MTRQFTDASQTPFNQTNMDKVITGDSYTNGVYMHLSYWIYYTGAVWTVSTTHGSKASAADVVVAWNATDYRLDIDLSGLTYPPASIVNCQVSSQAPTAHATGPYYLPVVHATSATDVYVRFVNLASPSAFVTTQATAMAFQIDIVGAVI